MYKEKYLVDGRFLASMTTGVDRYAYQILKELDKICADLDISILVPPDAKEIPEYTNIKIIKSHRHKMWTQVVFGGYAFIHKMTPVNLCNEVSLIAKKGIVCLHDVCYAETKEVFPYVDEIPEDEKQWFLKIYKRIVKKTKKIITVSEFSKERIEKILNVPTDKIEVIGNGWQHFENVGIDESIFEKNQNIKKGEYYFTLTSANNNKNLKWVLENSRFNPNANYVVAGKNLSDKFDFSKYPNVYYAGFATDEMAKSYMTHCKAFLFPSYYEGFGIPPLEALSTGARIIISDRASLPEIFGKTAQYVNPDNADVDLDLLLGKAVELPDDVLNKYSWKNSAYKLKRLLEQKC